LGKEDCSERWACEAEGHIRTGEFLAALRCKSPTKPVLGTSPLLLAAGLGDLPTMRSLIRMGASVDLGEASDVPSFMVLAGSQPLHTACMHGHSSAVAMLLKYRANIRARTSDRSTPMHLATFASHESVLRELLARRADIDARDIMGVSVLDTAVSVSKLEAMRFLMASGVSLACNANGMNPLHTALGVDEEIVRELAAGGVSLRDRVRPIFGSLGWGIMLRFSLAYRLGRRDGYSFIFFHALGATPCLIAAAAGHLCTVDVLLRHRANLEDRNDHGVSVVEIFEAAGLYSASSVNHLLWHGPASSLT